MLPKERVLTAFEHRPTDMVPIYHVGISSRIASVILGREAYVGGGIQQWREAVALWHGEDAHAEFIERSFRDAIDIALALDQDIVRVTYWRMRRKPIQRIDEWTFMYGDPHHDWWVMRFEPATELYQVIDRKPKPEPTLEDLERTVEAYERAAENYEPNESTFEFELRAQKLLGHERIVRVGGINIGIPRERIWLEAIILRPDIVARHLDAQLEIATRNVKFLARHGFKLAWGGGDFASNKGPFYSPKAFHELVLPRLQQLSQVCHQHGMYHLFASDGNLWSVADDLFGCSGVDGFYEIDRRAGMDLRMLRERYPHLTLIGNISSHALHCGMVRDVINETLSCLEEAKRSGSIIVGCSNLIVPQTPIENMMAMVKTIKRYR